MTDNSFIENDGSPGTAQGGRRPGRQLRRGVLPGEGPRTRAHHRVMVGGRQTRLPRSQLARGVRRRRRRHVRTVAGDGGDGGRGQRAAADGGIARHQRHDHQQVRHRGAEEALDPGHRRRHPRRWRSRSPSPTPDPTRTRSPPPHAATAATGFSRARRFIISGIDQAQAVLVVGRTEEAKTGKLKSGAVRGADRRARIRVHPDRDGADQPRDASSRSSSTTSGCPPTRSSAPRTPPSRSFSPA